MHRQRREDNCGDYSYYDIAISSCTPCDHLCDNHEYQRTTAQCINKCYKYYQRMQHPTPQHTTQSSPGHPSSTDQPQSPSRVDLDGTGLILAVLVPLLFVGCVIAGVVIWRMRKKNGTCCCWREKRKTPVPCCEENGVDQIDQIAESQKSLLNSKGPICQPKENPHYEPSQETTQVRNITRYLGTLGTPYWVLDGPSPDVSLSRANTESGDSTYATGNISSTVPVAYSESRYTPSETNINSSTTPKVVYTLEEDNDMNSSHTGTLAEPSLALESYIDAK